MDLVEAASASALPTDGALESSPPQSAPGAPPPRSSVATQATPRPTASDAACEARRAHSATVSLDVRVGAALGAALGAPPADAEQRLSALSRELRSVESAHARLAHQAAGQEARLLATLSEGSAGESRKGSGRRLGRDRLLVAY